jgi:hypothetical protein
MDESTSMPPAQAVRQVTTIPETDKRGGAGKHWAEPFGDVLHAVAESDSTLCGFEVPLDYRVDS